MLPISRNTIGIDIFIFSATKKHSIQVKTLSKRSAIPLGSKMSNLIADFYVICRNYEKKVPELFIATKNEIIEKIIILLLI